MKQLVLILISPKKAVLALKARPRWLVAFLILAAVSISLEGYTWEQTQRMMLDRLPASATLMDKQVLLQDLTAGAPARIAFLPVKLFVGWALFALLLLGAARAVAEHEPVKFTYIFPLVVHSGSIPLVGKIVGAMGVVTPGASALPPSPPGRLASALSAASVFRPADFVAFSLLDAASLFSLWQAVVLGIGLSAICGFPLRKALAVSVSVWMFSVLVNVGVLALLRENMHLMP